MTENKRFTNVNEDIFQYGEWYCSAKSEHCADVIATALNMVTEENEQLKSICQDHRDHAIDFKADCVRLEKENEQLKQLVNIADDLIDKLGSETMQNEWIKNF